MIGFHNKKQREPATHFSKSAGHVQHFSKSAGFTLIEILVATSVFSILAIIVGGIFMQSSSIQRKGASAQKVQENALYIFETMAREIRVSKITSSRAPECDAETLTIQHPVNGNIIYSLSNDAVTRNGESISSNDVKFTNLKFCILKNDQAQPRITILTSVTAGKDKYQTTIDLQTTISSRDLSDAL